MPLILLHGALGSKAQWLPLIEALSDKFEIFTFNFSGHGGKPTKVSFSVDLFVNDLLDFMNANEIEKADLLGYSMGGYIALKFAADHPSRVGKIMTVATKVNWTPETAKKEVEMLNPTVIMEKVPYFGEALADRHAPLDWKDVVNSTSAFLKELGDGAALNFSAMEIPHETQICVGDLDVVVKFGEAVKLAEDLINAKFVPLPGAKHPIEQVDVSLLARAVNAFFGSGGSDA